MNEIEILKSEPKKQYIYFIHDKDKDLIKIGFSNDVNRRLRDLVSGTNFNFEILYCKECLDKRKMERRMHGVLKFHRVRGEWFRPIRTLRVIEAIKQSEKQYLDEIFTFDFSSSTRVDS